MVLQRLGGLAGRAAEANSAPSGYNIGLMLKRIDRILLRVPALDSAIKYYRDVLGLKLTRHSGGIASFKLAEGDTELVLHADADLPADATYFLVDDVRDLYKRRHDLKLKFSGPPVQVSRGYRAAVKDPFGTVLLLLDRTAESAAAATTIEDARPPGALFAGVEQRVPVKRDVLIKAYEQVARTADDLPYTPQFETLRQMYVAVMGEPQPTRQEVWRHLLNLRKAGQLPKLGEAKSRPPKIDPQDEQRLRALLGPDIGKRDRLPYTDRFDELVNEFNKTLPRRLSPHLVWRIVAKLAK
jgi:catechol 2,3-dioxygenase-like lactoylglutathione lyase family enzyme